MRPLEFVRPKDPIVPFVTIKQPHELIQPPRGVSRKTAWTAAGAKIGSSRPT